MAAKMAPINPWIPNNVNEYVLKMLFSLANFFSIKFITMTWMVAETTPITIE